VNEDNDDTSEVTANLENELIEAARELVHQHNYSLDEIVSTLRGCLDVE
jgi:hypothetical protein